MNEPETPSRGWVYPLYTLQREPMSKADIIRTAMTQAMWSCYLPPPIGAIVGALIGVFKSKKVRARERQKARWASRYRRRYARGRR